MAGFYKIMKNSAYRKCWQLYELLEIGCQFFLGYQADNINLEKVIREKFYPQIRENSDLAKIIVEYPIELSYCLALINTDSRYFITPP